MIRVLFFLIVFTFSSSSKAFYDFTKRELKEAWRDSGFNSMFFRLRMKRQCYTSSTDTQKVSFSSCMIALHYLVSSITKDKPMQVRVSPSNKLEIVPYPDGQTPEIPGDEPWNKRRESFIAFFLSQTEEKSMDQFISIEGFDDILEQSLDLLGKSIPIEDQSYYLGMSYNQYFLENNNDPYIKIFPQSLSNRADNFEYIGVEVRLAPYKTRDEYLNGIPVINPFKGSPAQSAGLRKGDLLLAVNGMSVKGKLLDEIRDQTQPPEGHSVKLTVQSFCEGETKDITITSKKGAHSFNITEDSYFINIEQPEPLSCDQPPPANEKGLQALYVPLKTFLSPVEKSSVNFSTDTLHFCDEFIQLQKKDLGNPKSLGMIIDLRGNQGGRLHEMACMLNTIISDTDIMLRKIPFEFGKIADGGDSTHYYFTDVGLTTMAMDLKEEIPHTSLLLSYNKNIVVLVDEHSMSASELFAGTLQDKKRGWVIGNRTAGKGSTYNVSYVALTNKLIGKSAILRQTKSIYTLNSGRAIQDVGIVPDFLFSNTGEPIEDNPSMKSRPHFKNINLDTQWEQNRPDEVASLSNCIHQDHKVSSTFKRKIQQEERYNRPFVADYQLELAKDILTCSSPVKPYIIHSESYSIFKNPYKTTKQPFTLPLLQ